MSFEAITRGYPEVDRVRLRVVWNGAILEACDLIRACRDSLDEEKAGERAALDDVGKVVRGLQVQVIEVK